MSGDSKITTQSIAEDLLVASRKGDCISLKTLLESIDVNKTNKYGDTALRFAVEAGQTEAVKLLLNANADPNIANMNGDTPLMDACFEGHIDLVKELLMAGAKYFGVQNSDTETAFSLAVRGGNQEIIELFKKKHKHIY